MNYLNLFFRFEKFNKLNYFNDMANFWVLDLDWCEDVQDKQLRHNQEQDLADSREADEELMKRVKRAEKVKRQEKDDDDYNVDELSNKESDYYDDNPELTNFIVMQKYGFPYWKMTDSPPFRGIR